MESYSPKNYLERPLPRLFGQSVNGVVYLLIDSQHKAAVRCRSSRVVAAFIACQLQMLVVITLNSKAQVHYENSSSCRATGSETICRFIFYMYSFCL